MDRVCNHYKKHPSIINHNRAAHSEVVCGSVFPLIPLANCSSTLLQNICFCIMDVDSTAVLLGHGTFITSGYCLSFLLHGA